MGETGYRVLIIDDDEAFKKLAQIRLKAFMPQMTVESFGTLKDARQFLEKHGSSGFDIVLLDEHLPDGRGIDLLNEGWFEDLAVISISSDTSPEIPGSLVKAGAAYFLAKTSISEPLFKPLVLGIIDRNKLRRELVKTQVEAAKIDTIKTLVSTLRHEINNPLGAVMGGAFLIRHQSSASPDQIQAGELVEASAKRIKHVLDKLCEEMSIDPVNKANQKVFHIPGDAPWEDGKKKE